MGRHDNKLKKSKKHKYKKSKYRSSSSDSSSSEEWVEKERTTQKSTENSDEDKSKETAKRDDWMSLATVFSTTSNLDRRKEREETKLKEKISQQYDPRNSIRELNPYWKSGGDGLPTMKSGKFMKPGAGEENSTYHSSYQSRSSYKPHSSRSNWRKSSSSAHSLEPTTSRTVIEDVKDEKSRGASPRPVLEKEMNELSARIIKEEIRGNAAKAEELKAKLRRPKESGRNLSLDRDKEERTEREINHPSSRNSNDEIPSSAASDLLTEKEMNDLAARIIKEEIRGNKSKVEELQAKLERAKEIRKNANFDGSKSRPSDESSGLLSEKEMNDLAARIIKEEIRGNKSKVQELKAKMERAVELRKNSSANSKEDESVLLFRTDSKGFSRPLEAPDSENSQRRKKKKIDTHTSGQRQKYYPDDDKYSLKQMFEREKFGSSEQQDAELANLSAKLSKADENMDEIFMDKIRSDKSSEKAAKRERDRAIWEHQKMSQSLDNCQQCIQSSCMLVHLMISLGQTAYLSLPAHEPITEGHCLIIPTRHVSCATQLDENEWAEVLDFRKALTQMFLAQDKDVIFYETVRNAHSYSHMVLHCVPVEKEQGDLAPIYFKKAIDECETEWSTNKKLISLAGRDVRKAVPKGLPYFFVSFGMSEGFAHVIEDEQHFPKYFAAEIIGGILDLHHSKWLKPHKQNFDVQKERVLEFSSTWKKFDCTDKK